MTTKNSSLWQINLTYTIVKTINKRSVCMAFWICCLSLTGMATIIISLLNGYVCISYFFVLEKKAFISPTHNAVLDQQRRRIQANEAEESKVLNKCKKYSASTYDCQVPIARSQTVQCFGKCG